MIENKEFEKFLSFLRTSNLLNENSEKAAKNVFVNLSLAKAISHQVLGLDASFVDLYQIYQMLLQEKKSLNAHQKGSEGGDSA